MRFTLHEVRARTYKPRDAWWTVLLVDPVASRLVKIAVNRTRVTPNQLTFGALALGLGAAGCFFRASWPYLVAGAVLYHLSFLCDCMDGKVARLTSTSSVFGAWQDFVFDRIRVAACCFGLMYGQYLGTGRGHYLLLAALVVFLDMFRYLDALEMARVRETMSGELRDRLDESDVAAAPPRLADPADPADRRLIANLLASAPQVPGGADTATPPRNEPHAEPQRGARPWWGRHLDTLRRRRIRAHLFSGVEFQMAVFIVAPLCGTITPVVLAAAVLLVSFELAFILRLWQTTRRFDALLRRLPSLVSKTCSV